MAIFNFGTTGSAKGTTTPTPSGSSPSRVDPASSSKPTPIFKFGSSSPVQAPQAAPSLPSTVTPTVTPAPKSNFSSIEDTIGNNIGGAEVSLVGGALGGLGKLVDLIGGNITRGLNKIMPIYDKNEKFDEFKNQAQKLEDTSQQMATNLGTKPIIQSTAKGLGEFAGEKGIPFFLGGEAVEATQIPNLLRGMLQDVPVVGRYLAPVVANTLKNLGGFSAADQTTAAKDNPKSSSPHWDQFKSDLTNSALFAASGAIPQPLLGIPATGIAAYTAARLSGASHAQALASAIVLASMHGAGLLGTNTVPTAADALEKSLVDARAKINEYSKTKINENSSSAEIKKAYFEAAHATHPDKTGGTDKNFKAVNYAHQLLQEQIAPKVAEVPSAPNIEHPLAVDGQTPLTPENTPPVTYTPSPEAPQSTQGDIPTLPDTFPVSTPKGTILNNPEELTAYLKAGNPPTFYPFTPKVNLSQTAPGETPAIKPTLQPTPQVPQTENLPTNPVIPTQEPVISTHPTPVTQETRSLFSFGDRALAAAAPLAEPKPQEVKPVATKEVIAPKEEVKVSPIDTSKYSPASKKSDEIFAGSKDQTPIKGTPFVLGSFGRNAFARKGEVKGDRFPVSQLAETLKRADTALRANSNPSNYRYDNIAHVATMPDGEKRVVYTRLNADGKEEVVNWHKVSNPNYIEDLSKSGAPDQSRTDILSLERSRPNPLADRGNEDITPNSKASQEKISPSTELKNEDKPNAEIQEYAEGNGKDISFSINNTGTIQKMMTTKVLDRLTSTIKKDVVSKATIEAELKREGVKKIEADILKETLADFEGDKVNLDDFIAAVRLKLLPLTVMESDTYASYGLDNLSDLRDDLPSKVTYIFNSPLDHGYTGHFSGDFDRLQPGKIEVVQIPTTDKFAVVSKGVALTADNLAENTFGTFDTKELADTWIKDHSSEHDEDAHRINKGLFGHARVWTTETNDNALKNAKEKIENIKGDIDHAKNSTKKWENFIADLKGARGERFAKEVNKYLIEKIKLPENRVAYKGKEITPAELKKFTGNIKDIVSTYDLQYGAKALFPTEVVARTEITKGKYDAAKTIKAVEDFANDEVFPNDKKEIHRLTEYRLPEAEKEARDLEEKIKNGDRESEQGLAYVAEIQSDAFQENRVLKRMDQFSIPNDIKEVDQKISNLKETIQGWEEKIATLENNKISSVQEAPEIEERIKNFREDIKDSEDVIRRYNLQREDISNKLASIKVSPLENRFAEYKNVWHERIIRETLGKLAQQGVTTARFPMPRTLALIEGYISNDGEGTMPYEINGGSQTDDLSVGDTITYGGDDYKVVSVDGNSFEAAPSDTVRSFGLDSYVYDEVNYREEEADSEIKDIEKKIGTIDTQAKAEEALKDKNISSYTEDLIQKAIDSGDENFSLEDFKDAWKEDTERSIYDNFSVDDLGYSNAWEADGKITIVEDGAHVESFNQPDQYDFNNDLLENFDEKYKDSDSISDDQKNVLNFYEKKVLPFVRTLAKEHQVEAKDARDDYGNDWLEIPVSSKMGASIPAYNVDPKILAEVQNKTYKDIVSEAGTKSERPLSTNVKRLEVGTEADVKRLVDKVESLKEKFPKYYDEKTVSKIVKLIETVPKETLGSLRDIHLLDGLDPKNTERFAGVDVNAYYAGDAIGMLFTDKNYTVNSFAEEYGHHFFEKNLTGEQRGIVYDAYQAALKDGKAITAFFGAGDERVAKISVAQYADIAKKKGANIDDVMMNEFFAKGFAHYVDNGFEDNEFKGTKFESAWSKLKALFDRLWNSIRRLFGAVDQVKMKDTKFEVNPSLTDIYKEILSGELKNINTEYLERTGYGDMLKIKPLTDLKEDNAFQKIGKGFKWVLDGITRTFNPVGQAPKAAVDILMLRKGEFEAEAFRTERAAKGLFKMWSKQPEAARMDFMSNMEQGTIGNAPKEFQEVAAMYRARLDNAYQAISQFKEVPFLEHYFPHFWENPDKVAKGFVPGIAGKAPIEGTKSFLKNRIFQTIQEGIKLGYVPVSTNPEEIMQLYETNVRKFIMAQNIKNDLIDKGLWKFIRHGEPMPEGYADIEDKIAKIYFPQNQVEIKVNGNEMKRFLEAGKYVAPKEVARLINNHLSKDKLRDTPIGKGLMNMKNTINALQLGLSAFHLTMESLDTVVSQFSVGLSRLIAGNARGLIDMVKAPIAPITFYRDGQKFFKGDPEMIAIEQDLFTGGASFSKKQYYKNTVLDKFVENIKQGQYAHAVLRAPFAAIEASMRPLFNHYIPRLKVGAFRALFAQELERNSARIQAGKITRATIARQTWNNIENRMGEINYDNLFWDKTTKAAMMLSFRSVGWNLGTIRELGGGLLQDPLAQAGSKEGREDFKNFGYDFTPKMSYSLSLFFIMGILGGVYQYLHTGKKPASLKDLYYPRNGVKTSAGDDFRVMFPSYLKDIYQFTHTPLTMVENKSAPELSILINLMTNKDYFGDYIRNENDNLPTQAKQLALFLLEELKPFTFSQNDQFKTTKNATTENKVEAFLGVGKAPADVIKSDYAKALQELFVNQMGGSRPRTPEMVETDTLKAQARRELQKGDTTTLQILIQNGTLKSKASINAFVKNAFLTGDQRMFKSLSKSDKLKLLQQEANPQ